METLCDKCNGTGWILESRDGEQRAVKCDCRKTDILISKGERANIPRRFMGMTLEWGYTPDSNNPSQAKAKKVVQQFINNYPAVDNGIMFQGSIGVGKTSLLCTIGYELIKQKNVDVYYIDWNDLVREMRSGEDHTSRDFSSISLLIQKLTSVDLLLFDELGASNVSPWVYDNIYYLFNHRYNNKKTTVCATNFTDNPMDGRESLTQRIGDRIRSRLYEMTNVYEIKGSDFRRKTLSGQR